MRTTRNLALQVLNRQARKSTTVDHCLEDVYRRNRHLDHRDRAFLKNLVQGVNRWRLRLDWIIEQTADFPKKRISPTVLNILRLALFQILFLDRVPESAAVNEAVKQIKRKGPRHAVPFVNGILRTICRQKDHVHFPDPINDPGLYLSVFHSYPEWLVQRWLEAWGRPFTEDLLAAGNRVPSLTLRTNRLRSTRKDLIRLLEKEGVHGKPTPYAPDGILLEDFRGKIDDLTAFREGRFQVQDEAAQITSYLLDPGAGDKVLDICAGYGGKSSHMAELMGGRGSVLALDISHSRLVKLGQNSKRLLLKGMHSIVADASGSLSALFRCQFPRIMVDAPCSGLGVLSRHPDGKWRRCEEDIYRLARLQKEILNRVVPLLQHGGQMLYVTCTMSKEENEGVVDSCLKDNRDIRLEDLRENAPVWARELIDEQGFFRTFPHRHHMDGFFAALFKKK